MYDYVILTINIDVNNSWKLSNLLIDSEEQRTNNITWLFRFLMEISSRCSSVFTSAVFDVKFTDYPAADHLSCSLATDVRLSPFSAPFSVSVAVPLRASLRSILSIVHTFPQTFIFATLKTRNMKYTVRCFAICDCKHVSLG